MVNIDIVDVICNSKKVSVQLFENSLESNVTRFTGK